MRSGIVAIGCALWVAGAVTAGAEEPGRAAEVADAGGAVADASRNATHVAANAKKAQDSPAPAGEKAPVRETPAALRVRTAEPRLGRGAHGRGYARAHRRAADRRARARPHRPHHARAADAGVVPVGGYGLARRAHADRRRRHRARDREPAERAPARGHPSRGSRRSIGAPRTGQDVRLVRRARARSEGARQRRRGRRRDPAHMPSPPSSRRSSRAASPSYRVLARHGIWYDAIADLSRAIESVGPGIGRRARSARRARGAARAGRRARGAVGLLGQVHAHAGVQAVVLEIAAPVVHVLDLLNIAKILCMGLVQSS